MAIINLGLFPDPTHADKPLSHGRLKRSPRCLGCLDVRVSRDSDVISQRGSARLYPTPTFPALRATLRSLILLQTEARNTSLLPRLSDSCRRDCYALGGVTMQQYCSYRVWRRCSQSARKAETPSPRLTKHAGKKETAGARRFGYGCTEAEHFCMSWLRVFA